jgi:hypothetical protein
VKVGGYGVLDRGVVPFAACSLMVAALVFVLSRAAKGVMVGASAGLPGPKSGSGWCIVRNNWRIEGSNKTIWEVWRRRSTSSRS